jgi:hypothetical protein
MQVKESRPHGCSSFCPGIHDWVAARWEGVTRVESAVSWLVGGWRRTRPNGWWCLVYMRRRLPGNRSSPATSDADQGSGDSTSSRPLPCSTRPYESPGQAADGGVAGLSIISKSHSSSEHSTPPRLTRSAPQSDLELWHKKISGANSKILLFSFFWGGTVDRSSQRFVAVSPADTLIFSRTVCWPSCP